MHLYFLLCVFHNRANLELLVVMYPTLKSNHYSEESIVNTCKTICTVSHASCMEDCICIRQCLIVLQIQTVFSFGFYG